MTHEQLGKSCSFVQSNDPLVNENLAFCSCGNYTHVSNLCSVFGCTKKAKWRIKDKRYCALHYNQKHAKLTQQRTPPKPEKKRKPTLKMPPVDPSAKYERITFYHYADRTQYGVRYYENGVYRCRAWNYNVYNRDPVEVKKLAQAFANKLKEMAA